MKSAQIVRGQQIDEKMKFILKQAQDADVMVQKGKLEEAKQILEALPVSFTESMITMRFRFFIRGTVDLYRSKGLTRQDRQFFATSNFEGL